MLGYLLEKKTAGMREDGGQSGGGKCDCPGGVNSVYANIVAVNFPSCHMVFGWVMLKLSVFCTRKMPKETCYLAGQRDPEC